VRVFCFVLGGLLFWIFNLSIFCYEKEPCSASNLPQILDIEEAIFNSSHSLS